MNALDIIKFDEGLELKPYRCPAGKLTIGYGHNLDDNGITKEIAEFIFKSDVTAVAQELRNVFAFYDNLSEVRQGVLLNMAFNMGIPKLLGFKKMIAALEANNYLRAAQELVDSKAARELPKRYQRLYQMMLHDVWPSLVG